MKQQDITDKELADIARKKRAKRLIEQRGKGNIKVTRPKKPYLFEIIPKWLLYSGLPRALNEKHGKEAWYIFERLIILDCRYNPGYPDWFDQTYQEIADLTGLSRRTVSKYIRKFEKAKLIRLVRGKFKGSRSRFKINDFRTTPISPNKILYRNGGLLGSKGKRPYLRYYQRVPT